jgi:hypothetical protein
MYFKTTNKDVLEEAIAVTDAVKLRFETLSGIGEELDGDIRVYSGVSLNGDMYGFSGIKFNKKIVPDGWTKPDKDNISRPLRKNTEMWIKLDSNRPSCAKLMKLLNFPEGGIRRDVFDWSTPNHLYSLRYQLVKDNTALVFIFPDEYLEDSQPSWMPPEHAVEILTSEYLKLTKVKAESDK